jgi:hypothetical protein
MYLLSMTMLINRVAGHPLLQTGSKVLCAFIQDPQWDKVGCLPKYAADPNRINGVNGCAFVAVGLAVLI